MLPEVQCTVNHTCAIFNGISLFLPYLKIPWIRNGYIEVYFYLTEVK